MFGQLPTKNLYLVALAPIISMDYSHFCVSDERRYALCRKVNFLRYKDIFTGTEYREPCFCEIGDETVIASKAIMTDKKFIPRDVAISMLEDVNPTYYSNHSKSKIIKRNRNHENN